MMRGSRLLLTVAAAVVLGAGVPANAATAPSAVAGGTTVQAADVQAACDGDLIPRARAYDVPNGCKFKGSRLATCKTWQEKFVVAPDHTIWHVWPGSGKWKEMPGKGWANDMWACYVNGNGQHQVEVCLDGGGDGSVYYSYLTSQGWNGWHLYNTGHVDCLAGPGSKAAETVR